VLSFDEKGNRRIWNFEKGENMAGQLVCVVMLMSRAASMFVVLNSRAPSMVVLE
jgi:hypothetical protein